MKDWTQLQRELYQNTLKEVRLFLGRQPVALKRYEREFKQDQKHLKASSRSELFKALNHSDFVFFGDFHPLRQSQRLLIRLLREQNLKKPKSLGLEVLRPEHERFLEAWMRKPSFKTETALKKALQLEERWGSSFETYKELFQSCAKLKIEIFGLGTDQKSLVQRDHQAAKNIAKTKSLTWILFGEHHCSRQHIPKLVHHLASQSRILVVQQNDDEATLKYLSKYKPTKPLILRGPDWLPSSKSKQNSKEIHPIVLFHVLHTPLWIKWQSFLERHLRPAGDDEALGEDGVDPQNQISWSVQTLMQFLDDPRYLKNHDPKDVLDFSVIPESDPHFYVSISKLPPKIKRYALAQIQDSGIFVLTEKRRIYLSEMTINACAQAAGSYLYRIWAKVSTQNTPEFYQQCLHEALAFLLSKLLNHSRRARTWKDWQKASQSGTEKKAALAVLSAENFVLHFHRGDRWLKDLGPFRNTTANALGRILGDAAFEAFLAGELSRGRLIRLLTTPTPTDIAAFEVLVELKSIGRPFQPSRGRAF